MITVNKVQVPINAEQDNNKNKTTWLNGKYVSLDEGPAVTLFIGHTKETVIEADGREMEIALAFPVRVVKPVTRNKAINAAEMEAYGLTSALEVASLNASLSRKFREDINDTEVKEHDEFISWVKAELDEIGLSSHDGYKPDTTQPGLQDVMALSKMLYSTANLLAESAVKVKNFAPVWGEEGAEFGKEVDTGFRLRIVEKEKDVNDLFEVIQKHTIQSQWKPGSTGTESIYKRIDEQHAGTKEDPIPYPADGNMSLELGKYYKEDGITYECIEATTPLYAKLRDCPRYAKAIE